MCRRSQSTLCQIASRAPLIPLQLLFRRSISMRLAEEVEVLMAHRRAAWACDPGAYEQRLARADPLSLYCTCLERLSIRLQHFCREVEPAFIMQFACFLEAEIQTLREMGEWPPAVPPIEEIL